MAKKPRTPKPPRPSGSGVRTVQAPQRRTGPSRTARASGPPTNFFMRYFWPLAAGAVGVIILVVVLVIVFTRSTPGLTMPGAISWKDLPGLQTNKPPWPANATTLPTRLGSIGVQSLPTEGNVTHIHQHLDLYVDGKHVTVAQFIGLYLDQSSPTGRQFSELHTHATDGVIHLESARTDHFQLKQFFGVWGVRLTKDCLGSFKGSCDNLQWWLNGKKQAGSPANLVLKSHQEIAISVGKTPSKIPTKYNFPAGE